MPMEFINPDGVSQIYIDENNLPNQLWIDRNHIEERRQNFIKYFIRESSDDDGGDGVRDNDATGDAAEDGAVNCDAANVVIGDGNGGEIGDA